MLIRIYIHIHTYIHIHIQIHIHTHTHTHTCTHTHTGYPIMVYTCYIPEFLHSDLMIESVQRKLVEVPLK